jgi:fructose-1,6-bisphosphatase class II
VKKASGAPRRSDADWSALNKVLRDATSRAAAACLDWAGKDDKIAADAAAVDAMRATIAMSNMRFTVAIGEGELDDAPMLAPNEALGAEGRLEWDLAVDPLEGTYLCAKGLTGAVTTMAAGLPGTLLSAPDSYMRKVIAGPAVAAEAVHVDSPLKDLLTAVAKGSGKPVSEVVVCLLDKPRQQDLIEAVRVAGAKLHLIPDGDVPAALWACRPRRFGVDLYIGVGGSPEGVLSAAAVKALGGHMSARFEPQDDRQARRLAEWQGIDVGKTLDLDDMIGGDAVFAMASVTGSAGLAPALRRGTDIAVASFMVSTRYRGGQPRRFLQQVDPQQDR